MASHRKSYSETERMPTSCLKYGRYRTRHLLLLKCHYKRDVHFSTPALPKFPSRNLNAVPEIQEYPDRQAMLISANRSRGVVVGRGPMLTPDIRHTLCLVSFETSGSGPHER